MAQRNDCDQPVVARLAARSPGVLVQAGAHRVADRAVDEAVRPRVGATPPANQMVASWRARVGGAPAGHPARRSRRSGRCGSWCAASPGVAPAVLAALVLATSSQWAFITRQAMTDMPFVSPMTIALCFAAIALIGPEEEFEAELPRTQLRYGLSVPRATAWWVFFALFSVCTLPQLIVFSIQLHDVRQHPRLPRAHHRPGAHAHLLRRLLRRRVVVRAREESCASSTSSPPTCSAAMATLAKGPAGIALPGIVLVVWLVVAGRWRDIYRKLEIPRGAGPVHRRRAARGTTRCSSATARRSGRSSSATTTCTAPRGATAIAARSSTTCSTSATACSPGRASPRSAPRSASRGCARKSPRAQLIGFALVWFLVDFTTVSLVNTKFHHYILPALPALAVLGGAVSRRFVARADQGAAVGHGAVGDAADLLVRGAICRRSRRACCGSSTTTTSTRPAPGGRGRWSRSTAIATSTAFRSWCSPSRPRSPSAA